MQQTIKLSSGAANSARELGATVSVSPADRLATQAVTRVPSAGGGLGTAAGRTATAVNEG